MKAKLQYNWIGNGLVFLLAAVCLFSVVVGSNQSSWSKPIQQSFIGEYSRNGEDWKPLDDDAELSALNGSVILRGRFLYDIEKDGRLYYYQNHIGVTLYVNGECVFIDTVSDFEEHGIPLEPSMCGKGWEYILSPGITPEDEVEIRLVNPHKHGNRDAYRDFLNTLYNSPNTQDIVEVYLKTHGLPGQIAGIVLLIVALLMLGASLVSGLLRVPIGGFLWKYGLLSLFVGGFTILDTIDISFVSEMVVFNTYARQLCMMLAVYCMGLCVCDGLTGKRKTTAGIAMLLSALLNSVLIGMSFAGRMVIYDTGIYWIVSQGILCPLLIVCSIQELRHGEKKKYVLLVPGIFLMTTILMDIIGVGRSIYSHGTCTKNVFVVIFAFYIVLTVKNVVINHHASIRAEQLEKELADSRIATMLSQIQPHFIYNTLGTIEQLCKEQPEVAADLVHNFALYLRGNFSELDNTTPIRLSQEIAHVKYYVAIEHIRFPDMEIRFDLRADDFLLPALSIQPLVENAIKHGLMGLESGGTVTVSTYETDADYCVYVVDDGVGFDATAVPDSRKHVGIRNIRGRIEAMCGGTLTVESTPGKGTTAVITIPKERDKNS